MARGARPPAYLLSVRDEDSRLARRDLRRAGVEFWHPEYLEFLADGPVAVPLFPGYAFARISQAHQFRDVAEARGVFGVISFGMEYARVPERVWQELRAMCGPTGYIRLMPRFNRWSRVRVRDGISGAVGIVQERVSAARVRVLFQLLGRPVEMSVADGDLVAA